MSRRRKGISARQVRRLRAHIEANRCPVRPGLTHDWHRGIGMDPMSLGGVVEWWECAKCGEWEWS